MSYGKDEIEVGDRVTVTGGYDDDPRGWPGIVAGIVTTRAKGMSWIVLELEAPENGGCEAMLLTPYDFGGDGESWSRPLDDGWEPDLAVTWRGAR